MSVNRPAILPGLLICLLGMPTLVQGEPPLATPVAGRSEKAVPVVDGNYRLARQDVVRVTVYKQDDLTTSARIGDDGTIQMPLIGSVEIAGKTVREASSLIEALLKKDYLVRPQVAISIESFVKKRFTVLGQVKAPGSYEVAAGENLDVIQAIGMAGGYTRSANQGKILVKRVADGTEHVFRLNGKEMARGDGGKTFRIMPGDTITVEENLF